MPEAQELRISSLSDLAELENSFNYNIKHIASKRGFDILFSLVCLIVGLPLYFFIAFALFLSSPGSVIYRHQRVGRGGKFFYCYKFRTMHRDADRRLQELLAEDLLVKQEWQTSFKLKNDPRVTKLGSFLRKTSLDELPQFWNVLKGDLSVVGPRPVVKEEIETHYGEKAHKILSVRPGLTGLWQVSGRSNCSYKERIYLDERYLESLSFIGDLKLILKTIPAMISSKGAY